MRSRKDKTLDRLVRAFAEAVEELDFDAAEGWFATARLQVGPPLGLRKGPAPSRDAPKGTRRSA
jgi:hypothetical protein